MVAPVVVAAGIQAATTIIGGIFQHRAQKNAQNAANEANRVAEENLAFMKDRYNDWTARYGELSNNLADYYTNLVGSGAGSLVSSALANSQKEFQVFRKAQKADFAARGLDGSGLEIQADNESNFANAENRAKIRTELPQVAAKEAAAFHSGAIQEKSALLSGVSSASNTLVGAKSAQAQLYLGQGKQTSDFISEQARGAGAIYGSHVESEKNKAKSE